MLLVVAIAWIYVVLMVALVELFSPGASALGAFFTLVGWGLLPLSIVLYVLNTPARRKLRRRREAQQDAAAASAQPDGGGHAAGDTVAAERKEP